MIEQWSLTNSCRVVKYSSFPAAHLHPEIQRVNFGFGPLFYKRDQPGCGSCPSLLTPKGDHTLTDYDMQHLLHTILIDTIMVHLLFVLNPANEAQIFNFYNKARQRASPSIWGFSLSGS